MIAGIRKYSVYISIGILFFAAGFAVAYALYSKNKSDATAIREDNSGYQFIDPLLLSEVSAQGATSDFPALNKELRKYIDQSVNTKKADNVSIYFRDLRSGKGTGINPDEKYIPASMLKVVLLIAYLRAAETHPELLQRNVYFDSKSIDLEEGQYYQPQDPVKPGKTYSTQELLYKMVVDSDNNAMGLLKEIIGRDALARVYTDLKLPVINSEDEASISPYEYSRFYRVLYNSTYLSHARSEEVLKLLSETNFNSGLVAGVPEGIKVSHKFGERTISENKGSNDIRELHDCGIVYNADHPYFLCVMTRGSDYKSLETVIKDISGLVWKSVGAKTI